MQKVNKNTEGSEHMASEPSAFYLLLMFKCLDYLSVAH